MEMRFAAVLFLSPFIVSSCVFRKFNSGGEAQIQSSIYSCPAGFVPVDDDPTPGLGSARNGFGVSAFCIAQYEMKKPNDPLGYNRGGRDYEIVPTSMPDHLPWTRISRDEAAEACTRMSADGFSFGLISNGEWQAAARSIERNYNNWSGLQVGQGAIPMGHSDFSPNQALPVTDPSDGYSDTFNNNANGWKQRRTHYLSNGMVVWDMSGNVWEWIYEDQESLGIDYSNFERQEMPTLRERNRLLFGPVGNFGKSENMGMLWPGPNAAVARGSSWGFDTSSGLFGASVGNNLANGENDKTGFRCVARPTGSPNKVVIGNLSTDLCYSENTGGDEKYNYQLTKNKRLIVKDKLGKVVADLPAVDKKGVRMTLGGAPILVFFDAKSASGNRLFIYRKANSRNVFLSHATVSKEISMGCEPQAVGLKNWVEDAENQPSGDLEVIVP